LNRQARGILCPIPHVFIQPLVSESIRLRLTLMVLLECYKAHLVACGFQQEHGCDYDETFAPFAHMTTIHTLLIVTSVREWSISQLDVKNTFLNGELCDDVYMRPTPGYFVLDGMVCHLYRSLYGLKQSLGLGFNTLPLWS
jgi:hypothetical protein